MLSIVHLIAEPDSQGKCRRKYVPKIAGHRRGEHSDLPALNRLMSIKTYDIFGDFEIGQVYESSCLTVVQYDEKGDVISGIFLCNYPNVPSVPSQGWVHWLKIHYGMENITERETLFIHCLVWDDRYTDQFLEHLLAALFDMNGYAYRVILVLPPRVEPEDAFALHMVRTLPVGFEDTYMVQALYTSIRYTFYPRLKIRRAVEEDNDDLIPIIDADSSYVKEAYGEYYISEMMRHPDDRRQLIVSEDGNGFVTGAMCLNSTIDLDLLNGNFELMVYNGLRKIHEMDQDSRKYQECVSEISSVTFLGSSLDISSRSSKDEQNSETFERIQHGEDQDEDLWSSSEILEDDDTRKVSSRSVQFIDDDATLVKSDMEEDVEIEEIYRRKESSPKEGKRVRISDVVYNNDGSLHDVEQESQGKNQIRSSLRSTSLRKETLHLEPKNDKNYEDSLKLTKNSDPSRVLNDALSDFNDSNDNIVFAATVLQIQRIQTTSMSKHDESELSDRMQNALPASVYHGEVNAFVIEIFTVRENIGNGGNREFLEAAFESFPDLDYCALLLPPAYPYFSFLEHFIRVPLKRNKDFPMSLYLAHKATIIGKITCRKADRFDRAGIDRFLGDIPKSKEIMKHFSWAVNPAINNFSSYVFESDDVIIGIAIVCIEENYEEIQMHYHVEDFISSPHIRHDAYGRLLHFILMPIFSVHQKFFFCEIMRLNDLTVLYYRLYEEEASSLTRSLPIISCLHAMVPVNPRRRMEYKFCMCLGKDRRNEIREREKRHKEFSLFMTTPRLAMIPNRIIDAKIVVVGASDCGLAFLEFLALGYPQNFIHFTNLTLISSNGLPYEKKHDDLKWDMILFKGRYCRNYRRHLIAGRAWINVVCGTVMAINRNDKYVTVMNQGSLSYDFLILTCGLQYQKTLFRKKEVKIQEERDIVKSEIISNCLTINDDTEASVSLQKIRSATNDFKEKKAIVFYGHNISCYCALHGLMKHGVKGSWITFIEPILNRCETHDEVFFHNCEVDVTIMNAILENEVNILSGWNVIDWTLENCKIKSIVIRSGATIKTVPCDIFFNFYEKEIDINYFMGNNDYPLLLTSVADYPKTYTAISRAGLVFDGRLVINPQFRTNDPFVFAAGTVTKYARKFHGESSEHKYYDSIEIGEKLGKIIRKVVEAYQENKGRWGGLDRSKSSMLLPDFRSPVIVSCVLPGDYHYLHVGRPGKKLSNDVVGNVMVTGTCSSDIGYFRLHLNAHDAAESITCCSKKSFEVCNFIALYGKHDSMLNELKYRFEKSLISDFYAYFREPWALALFYDRFECLRVENRATLMSKANLDADSLLEDCMRALLRSEREGVSEKDRELITKKYVGSSYQQEIENRVIDFLQSSEQDLPVYCTPRLMRWLYADIESSPLFFEQSPNIESEENLF